VRILLAEDDPLLGDGLRAGLRQLGFQVDWVRDGNAAERELRGEPYEAAVLDLGLPLRDGMDVLAAVRRAGIALPILILTARDAVPDRIRGLDIGADDYVVKPVDLHELAARLRALVRRAHGQPQERLTAEDVELDPAARTVRKRDTGVLYQLARGMRENRAAVEPLLASERPLTSTRIIATTRAARRRTPTPRPQARRA